MAQNGRDAFGNSWAANNISVRELDRQPQVAHQRPRRRQAFDPEPVNRLHPRKVYVPWLHRSTTREQVLDYFDIFGPIERLDFVFLVNQHNGAQRYQAFVQFTTAEAAQRCLSCPSDWIAHKVNCYDIQVKPAASDEYRRWEKRQQRRQERHAEFHTRHAL